MLVGPISSDIFPLPSPRGRPPGTHPTYSLPSGESGNFLSLSPSILTYFSKHSFSPSDISGGIPCRMAFLLRRIFLGRDQRFRVINISSEIYRDRTIRGRRKKLYGSTWRERSSLGCSRTVKNMSSHSSFFRSTSARWKTVDSSRRLVPAIRASCGGHIPSRQ